MRQQLQFVGLSALSLGAVFTIAMLSRAELRLSGNTLAADGDDLAVFEELRPFDRVELIRETPELKLYLLKRGEEKYLMHVVKDEHGKWKDEKLERVHR